jgi:hypothetical protein
MMNKETKMIQLSPPSPEVRAIVKMGMIAAIVVGIQLALIALNHFFTIEEIVTGAAAGLIVATFYLMFQILVGQERHKDAIQRMKDVA